MTRNNLPQLPDDPGLCRRCDWKGSDERDSARGLMINCCWYGATRLADEIKECDTFSRGARLPSESRPAFEVRRHSASLEAGKFDLAGRADRRARWALVVSILALLISLAKVGFDILTVLNAAPP